MKTSITFCTAILLHAFVLLSSDHNTICIIIIRVSQDRLTGLISWYKTNGLVPKEKKSGGRANNINSIQLEDIKRVVQFLTNYARKNNDDNSSATAEVNCNESMNVRGGRGKRRGRGRRGGY